MLTRRGLGFFLVVLLVLAVSLATSTSSLSLLSLTLLLWFLASWLWFQLRAAMIHGRLRSVRQVSDARGPVQSLWVGRVFEVRVSLFNDSPAAVPYIHVQERVPVG